MSLFQKKLEDVVRGGRAPGVDPGVWNPLIMKELKEELKSKDPEVKAIALTKLFYFLQDGSTIDWAHFNIIDCMSSTNINAKKAGLMFASLVLYSNPDAMTMTTNYFKKEIKSNDIKDVSLVLGCLGNVCNKELGQELVSQVLSATSHTKPLIRKKALATLRTIFEYNPSLIQSCMDKIASRLQEEQEPNVLATCISLCHNIIHHQPALHPVLIKPLFSLFEGRKSNWVHIKLVKIFDKMITLEPRLKKKLNDVYIKMFSSSQAKSLEYELIMTVLNHFVDSSDLYQKACLCLKTFIDSQDPNLKAMGLESLKQLLQNDPKMINEYYDFLITCYKKGDHLNKITIAGIFAEFIDDRSVEETVNLMIADLPNMAVKESAFDAVDAVIKHILKICSKNYYANISDPEWFLMDVLLKIFPRLKNSDTAKYGVDILIDFSLRAEEIRDTAIEFGTKMLQSLDQGDISFRSVGQSPFLFTYETEDTKSSSVALRVIEALLFIFGEYSSHLKDINGFLSIIRSLERVDAKILIDVSGPLEISLTKLMIVCTEFIGKFKDDKEVVSQACEELEIKIEEANATRIAEGYIKRCLKLYSKTLTQGQGFLTFYANYYFAIILKEIDPNSAAKSEHDISLNEEKFKNVQNLKERIFQKMKPIQKNAQQLVKIPEEIQKLVVEISQEEQDMLKYFEKDITKLVQAVSKSEKVEEERKSDSSSKQEKAGETSQNKENGEEISPKQEVKVVKPKKEFKIRTEEEAPDSK